MRKGLYIGETGYYIVSTKHGLVLVVQMHKRISIQCDYI